MKLRVKYNVIIYKMKHINGELELAAEGSALITGEGEGVQGISLALTIVVPGTIIALPPLKALRKDPFSMPIPPYIFANSNTSCATG